jgi:hypothetical protein
MGAAAAAGFAAGFEAADEVWCVVRFGVLSVVVWAAAAVVRMAASARED